MAFTLLFIDGFDHYAIADITKKWNAYAPGSISSNTRYGYGYCFAGDGDSYAQKNISINALSVITGLAFYVGSSNQGVVNFREGTTIHTSLWLNSDLRLAIRRGTTQLQASSASLSSGNWYYIEFASYIHDTAGRFEVRVNDEVFLTGTNVDTRNGGSGYVNNIHIPSGFNRWDDLYIKGSTASETFEFIGDCRVYTLYPTSNGTYSQWTALTGTNYENIYETQVDNDTTYVSASGTSSVDTYNFQTLAVTNPTIYGIQTNIIARKDDSDTRKISPILRYSSTNYTGTASSITTDYADYNQIYVVPPWNPTGTWTPSNLAMTEFGFILET